MMRLVKRLIPKPLLPLARRIRGKLVNPNPPPRRAVWKSMYEALPALKCRIAYNQYGGYCVPESSRHRPAVRTVLRHGVHEPETIDFVLSLCGDGDVVHAGTYFGDFLPALSRGCAPGAKAWAFEPNRENYRCARITLLINDLGNVELAHAALGAEAGILTLRTTDDSGRSLGGTSRIVATEGTAGPGIERVEIVTVDGTVGPERRVGVIQLDVEGYEKEALSGALGTIRRCRPALVLEALPGGDLLESAWFAENVLKLGYRRTEALHGNVAFVADNGSDLAGKEARPPGPACP